MNQIIILDDESPEIRYLRKKYKRLSKAIDMIGPITYVPHENEYAFLVREVIGQMLSNKVARKLIERLQELCGG